jgi:site-specific DNA-cytosine methylase
MVQSIVCSPARDGFSYGFKQAGWHVIAANESHACAARIYSATSARRAP